MAVRLPNGSIISIASSYSAALDMTALSNADPAVATLENGHGVTSGQELEVTSGWSKINGRIARAGTISTDDVPLLGINTSDTDKFPPSGGGGSVRVIQSWQQILQVLDINTSGGEQQFTNYSFLEDDTERQIPTQRSPQSITINIADDPTLAHYAVLEAADEDRIPRALKLQLPSGSVIYYNAYVTMNKTPTLVKNEVMALQVTLSQVADPTRYVS